MTNKIITEVVGGELSPDEIETYTNQLKEKYEDRVISKIIFKVDGDYVNTECHFSDTKPFDRIRRITGYLVGTLDRFNDGKRAEEADRVKHTVS